MADTGPCGPSSEIFWDLGPEYGPDGGPAGERGPLRRDLEPRLHAVRRQARRRARPAAEPSIDTGAGLERNLAVLQDAASVWDIDVFRPLIAAAEAVTGVTYGTFPGTRATSRCASSPSTAAR